MSKSDPSGLSRINITDDADTIAKKVQKSQTDPEPLPRATRRVSAGRPEAENLVGIYATLSISPSMPFSPSSADSSSRRSRRSLADALVARIEPIAIEIKRSADPAEIDRVLGDGSARAREIASPIMDKVKDIVGFIRS
ncbi:hypothetical protein [Bradyrhizobium sp. RDI18]|uniref:hypothetical protein n=1 Tax=Bradyrhizobium sp. RDI18 TaxID=3367400 RepID=UPI00371895C9